jgi:saccharolysin
MNEVELKFNYTINEIESIKKNIISDYDSFLKNNYSSSIDFLNKYLDLTSFTYKINSIQLLSYVSDKKDIREASDKFKLDLGNYFQIFYSSISNYQLFLKYLNKIKGKDNLIKKILKNFVNNGVKLNNHSREIFIKKSKELFELENNFSKNIANSVQKINFTTSELEGIDESVIKNHNNIFDTSYPDKNIILKNCSVQDTRKKMYITFESVSKQNLNILQKILFLRKDISRLFGFKSSVEYFMSEDRLATPKKVENLVNKLLKIIIQKARKEYNSLLLFSGKKELKEYDIAYYSTLYKKKYFDINDNDIKKYFPSNYSIPKILDIYSSLFSIKIKFVKRKTKDIEQKYWNKDVELYKVTDKTTKKVLGYIYFDLYPRDNKYTHAMTYEIQNSFISFEKGTRIIPVAAIVCNFTPIQNGKKYSLLTFNEIITFCHELGHALHCILSDTKYEILSGLKTNIDFVELPSQFLENWCWNPQFLKKISKNIKTNKTIPFHIINSLIKNRYYNVGLSYLHQVLLIKYDLSIHKKNNISTKYLKDTWFKIANSIYPYQIESNIFPMCRFDHLMGYNCGYYSYLWSNIYAYNCYNSFKKNEFDRKIGMKYRKIILEKGAEIKGSKLVELFTGKKINNKYFFDIFNGL